MPTLAKMKPPTVPCKLNPKRRCSVSLLDLFGCRACSYPSQYARQQQRKALKEKVP